MPYVLKKVKDGYKVCLKSDPSTCFSKEGILLSRAKKQIQAIAISEAKEGGKRETYAEARAREARQQEEFTKKNEEAKAKAHHRTELQSSIAKKERNKQRREVIDRQMDAYKRVLDNVKERLDSTSADKIIQQYQVDIDKIKNYDFYNIRNDKLRDQLDAQYLKMYDNMKSRPRVYGTAPSGNLADPNVIRYVYEHYGQGERNFLDTITSGLEFAVSFGLSEVPVIGDVFDKGMELTHSIIDKEDMPKAGEDAGEVDYSLLDQGLDEQLAKADAERPQLEEELSKFQSEQKQIEDQYKLVDTELTPEEIAFQAEEMKGTGKPFILVGDAKPLTARLGGKVLLKKAIVDKFFPAPSTYSTYVEPFVGGGSVYFYKDKEGHKEVVNDLDPLIYTIFKGFQKYPAERIAQVVNGDYTKAEFVRIVNSAPSDEFGKFIRLFLINRLSYFAKSKAFGKPRINATFEGYQDRLKDATILKLDWQKVIKKYNVGTDTFFYLDPPLAKSDSSFDYDPVDITALKKACDAIDDQGNKFLVSLTDVDIDAFKAYDTHKIKTNYVGRRTRGGQKQPAEEWIVTNYDVGVSGSGKFGKSDEKKQLERGEKSSDAFMKQLEKLNITPDDYMRIAKMLAEKRGYDPDKLSFASDGDHKLVYDSPEGIRKFGKVGYGDFIIWSYLERMGKVPEGTAKKKQQVFHKSHRAMSKEYGLKKYSPNELALNINW